MVDIDLFDTKIVSNPAAVGAFDSRALPLLTSTSRLLSLLSAATACTSAPSRLPGSFYFADRCVHTLGSVLLLDRIVFLNAVYDLLFNPVQLLDHARQGLCELGDQSTQSCPSFNLNRVVNNYLCRESGVNLDQPPVDCVIEEGDGHGFSASRAGDFLNCNPGRAGGRLFSIMYTIFA